MHRVKKNHNWIGWNILLWCGMLFAAVAAWVIDKFLS